MPSATLTKSDFQAATQCEKRLYLQKRTPELATPASDTLDRRAEDGKVVGMLGRRYYPGGVLIDADNGEPLGRTAKAIDNGVETIYEATFFSEAAGAYVKCDILRRIPGSSSDWYIIEVKSGTKADADYLNDVAFQVYAVRAAGLNLVRASLLLVNNQYVFGGGELDLTAFFTEIDVTAQVEALIPAIQGDVRRFQTMLDGVEVPNVETNRHCGSTPLCEFHAHCHADQPEYDVIQLPRILAKQVTEFRLAGYRTIPELPDTVLSKKPQWTLIRNVILAEQPHFGAGLRDALSAVTYPLHFIDFESVASAIPLYTGTRPYQQVLFQWSNHIIEEPGAELRHEEFLHTSAGDPRPAFAETLWKSVKDGGTIVVYSSFEATWLRDMAKSGIPYGAELFDKLTGCVFDILAVVKAHVYHPGFKGSFSVKKVLPSLVPELSYDGLLIHDGDTASVRYLEMQGFRPSEETTETIAKNLLEYSGPQQGGFRNNGPNGYVRLRMDWFFKHLLVDWRHRSCWSGPRGGFQ